MLQEFTKRRGSRMGVDAASGPSGSLSSVLCVVASVFPTADGPCSSWGHHRRQPQIHSCSKGTTPFSASILSVLEKVSAWLRLDDMLILWDQSLLPGSKVV